MSSHPSFPPSLKRRDIWALLALAGLVLVFFWKLAFTNLIIARGDIFYYFYPYRDFAAQAVREGRVALWNPYLFMGAPFMANSQVGFFYPFNLLLSWLEVTPAINWTIVLHIVIAASGAYAFARSRLRSSIAASLLVAVSFGLGGYLGTQIEHVNQLQGLAWIGWIFLAYEAAVSRQPSAVGPQPSTIRKLKWILLALLITLQLLAGHTQSVFITLVGLGVYVLWQIAESIFATRPHRWRSYALLVTHYVSPFVLAAIVAAGLSALQLLPTLELTRNSARSGGLPTNLAVSFSLDPRLLGRALLPDYEGALPAGGEFTAFFSVIALVLLTIGVTTWRRAAPQTRAVIIVAFIGLFFALGGYNPLYYLLLKIPGFDLFRAPARWIVLFAFAGSLLAGVGLDAIRERRVGMKALAISSVVIIALIGLTFLSADLTPAGAAGPLGRPDADTTSLRLWLSAALTTFLGWIIMRYVSRFVRYASHFALCLVWLSAVVELMLAARPLVYNSHSTAPDAFLSLRPPITYLMQAGQGDVPPDRFLSISDIFFDPGDMTELQSIFSDQLPKDAFYDLIVATKMKEIIAPNLPLYYRLPAVDGYDGGVLPLKNYLEFQKLFLDPALIQTDGRLREQLKSIPNARWLDLMNAKYIITDKVGDQWHDGVLFDQRFETEFRSTDSLSTDRVPALQADGLKLVYYGVSYGPTSQSSTPFNRECFTIPSGSTCPAEVEISFTDGETLTLPINMLTAKNIAGVQVSDLNWSQPKQVKKVTLLVVTPPLTLYGIALTNRYTGAFDSFVLAPQGRFALAHSGDVKIYENSTVLPRAFFVADVIAAGDDELAIQLMRDTRFNPTQTVVLNEAQFYRRTGLIAEAPSQLVTYESERVVIEVNAPQDGYLVLTDAYYPGWTATVDGQTAEIERADLMFRAVKVTAGQHRVEFRYQPQSFAIGAVISIGTTLLLGAVWLSVRRRNRSRVL